MLSAFVVMLIGDFPLRVIFHGNILIPFLPIKWDVVGFSKSGCWDDAKFRNLVLRDQSHSMIPFYPVKRNQLFFSYMRCYLPYNEYCGSSCEMVVFLNRLFF